LGGGYIVFAVRIDDTVHGNSGNDTGALRLQDEGGSDFIEASAGDSCGSTDYNYSGGGSDGNVDMINSGTGSDTVLYDRTLDPVKGRYC